MLLLCQLSRMAHIYASKSIIIGLDNGLSPGRRQAIIWINARMPLIGRLWTNFRENLIGTHVFPFKKTNLKMLSGKWRAFSLRLNVLNTGKLREMHSIQLRLRK